MTEIDDIRRIQGYTDRQYNASLIVVACLLIAGLIVLANLIGYIWGGQW